MALRFPSGSDHFKETCSSDTSRCGGFSYKESEFCYILPGGPKIEMPDYQAELPTDPWGNSGYEPGALVVYNSK